MSAPTITVDDFIKVDIRAGTVLSAARNSKAKNPCYVLEIDFGPLGVKTSSAQLTQNYSVDELAGKQVCAVVNFPPLRVAGVKSEALVLAVVCESAGTVLVEPNKPVANGARLA